jgi:succinate-acetate transporter protein
MVASGLVMVVKGNRTGGFFFLALGAFWFFYAMRARKSSKNAKTDDEGQGPAD